MTIPIHSAYILEFPEKISDRAEKLPLSSWPYAVYKQDRDAFRGGC